MKETVVEDKGAIKKEENEIELMNRTKTVFSFVMRHDKPLFEPYIAAV